MAILLRRVVLLIFPSIVVLTSQLVAQEKTPLTAKRLTVKQCEKLVETLASPHKAPFTEDYVFDLPKGLGESELLHRQRAIEVAYDTLSANIEVSMPVLMDHVGDQRFSFVQEAMASGTYYCSSVGEACSVIVRAHVSPYQRAVEKSDGEGHTKSIDFINDVCGGLTPWWKKRGKRSLADLQLEPVEWALRQSKPDYFSDKEWTEAKQQLEKMGAEIRTTNKPISVKHEVQFFSK